MQKSYLKYLLRPIARVLVITMVLQSVFVTNAMANGASRSWARDLDKVHTDVGELRAKIVTLEEMLKVQQLMITQLMVSIPQVEASAKKEVETAKKIFEKAKDELMEDKVQKAVKDLDIDDDVKKVIDLYEQLQNKDLSAEAISKIQAEIEKHTKNLKEKDKEVTQNYNAQMQAVKKSCEGQIGWEQILENKTCPSSKIKHYIETAANALSKVGQSVDVSGIPVSPSDMSNYIRKNLSPEISNYAMSLVPDECLPDCVKNKKAFKEAMRDKATMDFVKVQMAAMSSQLMTMALASGNPYLIAAAVALMVLMAMFENGDGDGDGDGDHSTNNPDSGNGQTTSREASPDSTNSSPNTNEGKSQDARLKGSGEKFDRLDAVIKRGAVEIDGSFATGYRIKDDKYTRKIKVPSAVFEKDGSIPITTADMILEFCSASATANEVVLKLLVALDSRRTVLKLVRKGDGEPTVVNEGILEGAAECK